MKINLERGFIEGDPNAIVSALIPIEELKDLDEVQGDLLVEFVHKMTINDKSDGIMIDKALVDMLLESFELKDKLIIGNKDTGEPVLGVLKDNGDIMMIEKQ